MPKITSLRCPNCGGTETIELTDEENASRMRGSFAQVWGRRFSADVRERFISGYCAPCWDRIFADAEV